MLDTLRMPAADDKRIIVAPPRLGGDLLARLEEHKFKHRRVADQLGVDFAPGRRAGNACRDKRGVTFAGRLPKIRVFTRKRSAVGRRIAATAGASSLRYGGMINGTSGSRISWHQSLLYRTLTSRNTQRSRHLSLAIEGSPIEPSYDANRAPIVQWAKLLHQKVYELSGLRRTILFYQRKLKGVRRPWTAISGPIPALLATLARIKWRIIGAHLAVTHTGEKLDLRKCTWKRLASLVDEATNAQLWTKYSSGTHEACLFAAGASSDGVHKLTRSCSSLSAEHRHALTSACTGGQWTQTRHVYAKHVDSDLCLLCGEATGNEWHRVFDCIATEALRRDHLEDSVRREAASQRQSHHSRWTRGHLPISVYPARPASLTQNRYKWIRDTSGTFVNEVFLDGSASHPTRLQYSASACSIVMMEVHLDLPRLGLQLNVALVDGESGPEGAETAAIEHLLLNCLLPILAWSDCQNVIDSFERGELHCTAPSHPQALIWRRIFTKLRDHGGGFDQLTLRKVKAHTNQHNFHLHGMNKVQWQGNRNADEGARTTATALADELGMATAYTECERIDKDHAGLLKWIARITALVNTAERRDAEPAPVGLKRHGAYKLPSSAPLSAPRSDAAPPPPTLLVRCSRPPALGA